MPPAHARRYLSADELPDEAAPLGAPLQPPPPHTHGPLALTPPSRSTQPAAHTLEALKALGYVDPEPVPPE